MDHGNDKQAKILACRKQIDGDPGGTAAPEELARRLGLSYPTFRRLFARLCGCSVYQYIRLRRVERSARELRESGDVAGAMELGGFQTLSGFAKAFSAVYGVSYARYAETRGRLMMKEPRRVERPGFFLAGQVYPLRRPQPTADTPEIPELPYAALEELERGLRQGMTLFGTRISWEPDADYYLLGSPLPDPRMTPEGQTGNPIPGGLFLAFPLPEDPDPLRFAEKRRSVWFYALRQFIPASPFSVDRRRAAYELYHGSGGEIVLPVEEAPGGL